MKKYLALIALLLISATVKAQFGYGIRFGVNNTAMSTDASVLSTANRTGFYAGLMAKYTLSNGLGVDVSAVYDQRVGDVMDEENTVQVKHQSIAIPLDFRFKLIGSGDEASIFAYTGPQVAFNLGDRNISFLDLTGIIDDAMHTWRLKTSRFSWNVGAGIMLLHHLQLNVNYNIALGKTGRFDGVSDLNDPEVQEAISNLFSPESSHSCQIGAVLFF